MGGPRIVSYAADLVLQSSCRLRRQPSRVQAVQIRPSFTKQPPAALSQHQPPPPELQPEPWFISPPPFCRSLANAMPAKGDQRSLQGFMICHHKVTSESVGSSDCETKMSSPSQLDIQSFAAFTTTMHVQKFRRQRLQFANKLPVVLPQP